nr:translation initiation factor IF-2-like [Manis javanica]XP_036866256.1 translation initiation factor IF-2-like [Manis javanica]XP_036866257.1 translation initiation factor IF-2-like [Manis javanica]
MSFQTGKGDCATTTTCSGLPLSRCLSPPLFTIIFNSHARQGSVCFPGTWTQINKHCSCSAPARPWVCPPPPPPAFHPRPSAPPKLHYPASALRASGPGNNFPKNRKEKKKIGVRTEPHPGAEKQPSPGRGSVCGASPTLRPGNNSTNARAAQLAASSRSPAAASRCPLEPGVPGRPASSPRNMDGIPRARLTVPSPGTQEKGGEPLKAPRFRPAAPHSAGAPRWRVITSSPPAQPGPPAARSARTRADARTDGTQPAAAAAASGRLARPKPRGPSDSDRPGRGRGARKALCRVSAGHKLLPRLPGASALKEDNTEGDEGGRRRGAGEWGKVRKKQQPLHPGPEKWPAASRPPAQHRGCGGGGGG